MIIVYIYSIKVNKPQTKEIKMNITKKMLDEYKNDSSSIANAVCFADDTSIQNIAYGMIGNLQHPEDCKKQIISLSNSYAISNEFVTIIKDEIIQNWLNQ
jgi:hypothetical protein